MTFAQCLFDGVPYCLDCADDVLDRLISVQLNPRMRSMLGAMDETYKLGA